MKKIYMLLTALMALTAMGASAQTLIDEGFENTRGTVTTSELPDGWSRRDTYTGDNLNYKWAIHHNATAGSSMSGFYYATCDAPTYANGVTAAYGPRKEYLITPELDLNDTYQLQFDWEAAAYGVLTQGLYTLQVAILEGDSEEVIFDITNEEQVRDSGVPADIYGSYMWTNWAIQTSKLDLSPWQGKKVKVAFIYNLLKQTGNILYLDNIIIKQHRPETGPIAELAQTSYEFPTTYIGEKFYSEQMTLKNVGLKGLKVTGFEAPECIGLAMDTVGMSLGVNETAHFQLYYKATLTSPTEADVTIKTNGGDVTIHVTVTKEAVPEGYYLELFEGDQFPPAGWVDGGGINQFRRTPYALEGDYSLSTSGFIEANHIDLPRLDMSDPAAPHQFMFTYYASINADEEYPANDLQVMASEDGGPFTAIWTSDYTKMDTLINVSIDLSRFTTDSLVLRFNNTECYYDEEYGMDPDAQYIIDRVLLPNLYGADGVPMPAALVAPADSAVNVYNKNITLSWSEAQFAQGYKLYLGKAENTYDVINGLDLGNVLTYTLATADNATQYHWKVVPYNSVGDAQDVPEWVFTTQADYTVAELPWSEDFEGSQAIPLGWFHEYSQYTKWSRSDYYPMDGKYSMMAYSNETEKTTSLTTPDVVLPAGSENHISFWWGNDRPVSLTKDSEQVHVNHSTAEDGIDAVFFDIFVDGQWKQLSLISNNSEGEDEDGEPIRYWAYESHDLSQYAGKTVAFRWRYISHNYSRSRGASLDNVKIEGAGVELSFSVDGWHAYKVNARQTETSGTLALSNLGGSPVTVQSVTFENPNFSTTLAEGTVIEPAASAQFTVSFNAMTSAAKDSVAIVDAMTVNLSDGNSVSLPVSGLALAPDIKYYGFEHDATGEGPAGFTVIDVDRQSTSPLTFWNFPNNGAPLSFFVLNDSQCYNSLKEPHGHQSLMTRCNSNGTFEDWIVSDKIQVGKNTKFEFDMRNWESVNSIMPASTPTVTVLVSTTSATNRNSFTQVGDTFKPELFNELAWDHLSYDLSQYAGQSVYVALKAQADNCLGAFYDNFEFVYLGLRGDVNCDGEVSVADITALIAILLEEDVPEEWMNNADVNGDGEISIADVTSLVSLVVEN